MTTMTATATAIAIAIAITTAIATAIAIAIATVIATVFVSTTNTRVLSAPRQKPKRPMQTVAKKERNVLQVVLVVMVMV